MAVRKKDPKKLCVMECFLLALRDEIDKAIKEKRLKAGRRYNHNRHREESIQLEKVEPTKTGFRLFFTNSRNPTYVQTTNGLKSDMAHWIGNNINTKELNEDARRWGTRKRKIAARKGKDKDAGPAF